MLREEVLGSREESRLFPPPGQGAGVVEMPARLGRRRNTHQKGRSILRLLFLLLPVLSAVVYCSGSTIWGKGALREASQLPEAEPQSLGNSQAWLEQKKRELKETVAQVSAARGNILQAVREVLEAHGVQEEKREEVLRLTEAAVQKVLENYLQMPDWALEAIGAAIDEERTSKSYGGQGKMTWWPSPFGFSSANPPETILQPRIAPGNCWAFQGSRGHVVIRLPEQIWPRAFTIWHISEAVSPSGEVSSAPKDFAVSVSLCLALIGWGPAPGKSCTRDVLLAAASLRHLSGAGCCRAPHPLGGHWGHVGFCASGGCLSASRPRILEHVLEAP
ncbi:uncharacterized protein LOC142076743 [Calonectris borealis]|uniref:uncharacterized protein LOC142076743 n=1 Tax=Calonectris borealis TaxID=1323832 RepID=UPI003F4C2751